MSHYYGQDIKYGVIGAPAPFTGDILSFSYRDLVNEDPLEDGASDIAAISLNSRKGQLRFEAEVRSSSDDFLDLSAGAKIAVAGGEGGINFEAGFLLAYEAVEEWNLMRRKTIACSAYHYPDGENDGDGSDAGALSAFTPSQTHTNLFPGNALIYSTVGLTHAAGIVHQLRITQRWQITDDDPSPAGKILGAFAHGYQRNISLLLLAKPGTSNIPRPESVLTVGGAPSHAGGYRITSAEPRRIRKKGMMYAIEAVWIPAFA